MNIFWSNRFIRKFKERIPRFNLSVNTELGSFEVFASYFDCDEIDGGWGTVYQCMVLTPRYTKPNSRAEFYYGDTFNVGEKELKEICVIDSFNKITAALRCHKPIIKGKCPNCGGEYLPNNASDKFCSNSCLREWGV